MVILILNTNSTNSNVLKNYYLSFFPLSITNDIRWGGEEIEELFPQRTVPIKGPVCCVKHIFPVLLIREQTR